MAEYTNRDREMLHAESTMWNAVHTMSQVVDAGIWTERIKKLQEDAVSIARELRDYNDQFEVEEDD